MKRLVMILIGVFAASWALGQQAETKAKKLEKIESKSELKEEIKRTVREAIDAVDVQVVMEEAMNEIQLALSDDDDDDDDRRGRGSYQQETQEMEIPLSKPGERGVLHVEANNGRITIKAYDGPTVKVKLIKYGKKVSNTSTNGLRRVGGGSFDVEAKEYQNVVEIESDGWGNRVDFDIQVPKNFNIKAESYNNGHIWIEGIEGLLEVESYNGPITLKEIKGAASASTYNGAIKVEFLDLEKDMPMAFSTYNGDVDLTLPGTSKITAKMKTNRDIYTDFNEFTLSENKPTRSENRRGRYSVKFEDWTLGEVNGGGPEVLMKTTNGNIYIRKNG